MIYFTLHTAEEVMVFRDLLLQCEPHTDAEHQVYESLFDQICAIDLDWVRLRDSNPPFVKE
jgi:hypothetical protein